MQTVNPVELKDEERTRCRALVTAFGLPYALLHAGEGPGYFSSSAARRQGAMAVTTDVTDDTALEALKLLGQVHDVVVLQLMDPAEQGLPGAGFVRAVEAETGKEFVSAGKAEWLDQEALEAGLRRAGIDHHVIRTDQPFAHKLRHYFMSRDLFGRGAR